MNLSVMLPIPILTTNPAISEQLSEAVRGITENDDKLRKFAACVSYTSWEPWFEGTEPFNFVDFEFVDFPKIVEDGRLRLFYERLQKALFTDSQWETSEFRIWFSVYDYDPSKSQVDKSNYIENISINITKHLTWDEFWADARPKLTERGWI